MESGSETTAQLSVATASRSTVEAFLCQYATHVFGRSVHQGNLAATLTVSDAVDKFIVDPKNSILAIERAIFKESTDAEGGESDTTEDVNFVVTNEVSFRNERYSSLLFLRRNQVIEAEKPIADQLQTLTLCDGNVFETMRSIIGSALLPFFKSFIRESGRGDRDGDKLALTVEKVLNEAEVALLHLQQNIDIPDIKLTIHPTILQAVQQAAEQNRKARADDLGDLVEDAAFLNSLQSGVGRWVKEIQKVCS